MNFLVLVGGGAQVLEQPLEFGLSSAEVTNGLGWGWRAGVTLYSGAPLAAGWRLSTGNREAAGPGTLALVLVRGCGGSN